MTSAEGGKGATGWQMELAEPEDMRDPTGRLTSNT
jgi:hypothetical protein